MKFKSGDWVELKEIHKKWFGDGKERSFKLTIKSKSKYSTAWKIFGLQPDHGNYRPYIWLSEDHFQISGECIE